MRGLLLLMLLPALAQATTVAVMPVEAPEKDAEGQRVLQALRTAAAQAGLTDKGEVKLNLPEARLSFSCFDEDPACMAQVGTILEAEQLIWARLKAAEAGFVLELVRIDVGQSTLIRKETTQVADVAGLEAAAVAFVKGAPMPVAAPARTRVSIQSDPAGAEVWIDEARMGETPVSIDLVHGTYRLELRHPQAPAPVAQTLEVGPETRSVRVPLGITGPVDPPAERSYKNLWISAGFGGLALVGAVVAAKGASDGDKAGTDASRAGLDRKKYDQLKSDYEGAQVVNGVGWGLFGAGVIGAGTFLYLHLSDSGVAVVPTGNGLGLVGTF
jgi:hypothetical protein